MDKNAEDNSSIGTLQKMVPTDWTGMALRFALFLIFSSCAGATHPLPTLIANIGCREILLINAYKYVFGNKCAWHASWIELIYLGKR